MYVCVCMYVYVGMYVCVCMYVYVCSVWCVCEEFIIHIKFNILINVLKCVME